MNKSELKKQIEEINKRADAGQIVEVTLEGEKKSVRLTVDAKGARQRRKTRSQKKQPTGGAENDSGTGARTEADAFHLDFGVAGDVSDSEIKKKIEQAVALSQTKGAAEDSGVPRVVLTRDEQKGVWVLFQQCSYRTGNYTITAPANYETDLASIPRMFWSIIAPEELSLAAPVFHDLIYRCAGSLPQESLNPFDGKVFERKETDDLFLELMVKTDVPRWKRTAAYWAVRGFAGFAWKKQN